MRAAHALPLSMLRPEDKEGLLVTVREIQGCVQILINLRDAGCLTAAGPDDGRTGGPPPVPAAAPTGERDRTRILPAALAAAVLLLLAGAAVLLSRDDAAVTAEAVLAQAGKGLREAAGLPAEAHDPGGVRLVALGEGEGQARDLAARSQRLTAEMEALDLTVLRRRGELDLVGASIDGLRRAAETGQEERRLADGARAEAEAGSAEARSGIEAAIREMAALRSQIAEQREALGAARAEGEAARAALRAEIADRLSELGRTAQTNHEAVARLAGMVDGLDETSRGIAAARDELSRQREHLVALAGGGSEADQALSEIKGRIAVLKASLAGTPGEEPGRQGTSGNDSHGQNSQAQEHPGTGTPAGPAVAALQPEEWRRIQQALAKAGHYAGRPDGRAGDETRAAIAKFQRSLGAEATGRLSPAQIDRLIPRVPVKQPLASR
ncbi:peptidoglycan-binding domain-containing protein [Methylobacterium terricola]|nr:peptidoglycan-binding domain-containing protein [Methylobacterium terricola]